MAIPATIHTARAHAQDAIHYAAWLMPGHCTPDGRESTFVSDGRLARAVARACMAQKLILAGITTRGAGPASAVAAVDAWAAAQGWDAWRDRPAGESP